jgi:hypothetical protein
MKQILKNVNQFLHKFFVIVILLSIFTTTNISPKNSKNYPKNHCLYSCRLPNGVAYGKPHFNITRAGVLIITPTGKKTNNDFENYGIIVGHDKNLNCWMIGQSGKIETKNSLPSITASRELQEETGGLIELTAKKIEDFPYIYATNNQLFIWFNENQQLANNIQKSVQSAQKNPNLPKSYKEINMIEIISIKDFLKLLELIDSNKIKPRKYKAYTTTGKQICLDKYYTEMFAHPKDHQRLEYTQQMFTAFFN